MAQTTEIVKVSITDQTQKVLDAGNYKGIEIDFKPPGPAEVKINLDNNSTLVTQKQKFQVTFPSQGTIMIKGANYVEPNKYTLVYTGNANTITIEESSGSNSIEEVYVTSTSDGTGWRQLNLVNNNPSQVVISLTSDQPLKPVDGTVGDGTVIWSSKGVWDNGKDRTFTSTDPDNSDSQMRAGENRSCHVDGKGTAYFSGARGRMYWYRTNYDFIMQFDIVWNKTIDNIGLRGRSRHNEGGGCDNAFGGYGANMHIDVIDFKSEDSHDEGGGWGSSEFKYPQPLESGQKYGIRFTCKDNPKPTFTFEIDYNDGKGFIQVAKAVDDKPVPCRVNRKSFEEISYLWLRTNGKAPKDIAISNVIISETSGIKQSGNKGSDSGGSGE